MKPAPASLLPLLSGLGLGLAAAAGVGLGGLGFVEAALAYTVVGACAMLAGSTHAAARAQRAGRGPADRTHRIARHG
jgi:hypothetical protein